MGRESELEHELRVQEEEVDFSVDDLLQLQYEVPSEAQLAEEDDIEGLGEARRPQPAEEASNSPAQPPSRKAAVLLELMAAAAGSDLDTKIAQFVDEIDEELLDLLQARIDVVAKVCTIIARASLQ